jgi:folate-binding protein YgfZ
MTTAKSINEELAAIRSSAAIYSLTSRAFLRITGSDATRWLNGMVTNNIAALAAGEGNYNFLLNAQGRIQGDCTIYREPGDGPAAYFLETEKSQIETIQTHLDKFIIMDDVELHRTPDSLNAVLLVLGPQAAQVLTSLNLPTPGTNRLTIADSSDGPIAILTTEAENRFALCADEDQIDPLRKRLNLPEISAEALEAFRILSGVPKFDVDIRDKDLPQETAQTSALHFSKGCYLGQEIVERIHSRGQVHRTFTQFTLTGEMPKLPATLESNGKPAGELTSAALVDGTIYALGYARREFLETHQPLAYAGGTAAPKLTPKT